VAAVLLMTAVSAFAQGQEPHIGYVFPAGGQRGDTFRVAVGGQRLRDATGASVSGQGVAARVVDVVRTLNGKQRASLARTLEALERARRTIEVVDAISEIRRELATQMSSSPALADTILVEVTVSPDAALGQRELRLVTPAGRSNPLTFRIGAPPEVTEGEMPEVPLDVQLLRAIGEPIPLPEPETSAPIAVKLPAVVNGQILPGSTDRYRFEARRGQKIVIVVEARELIPYIADGVPGWFAAAVSVLDSTGRELAYADHFRFEADPVLCLEVPADGEYTVMIRDSIYRGREDFVYRMTLGEIPFITDIFPLGCRAGTRGVFEVAGWNLPADKITRSTLDLPPGIHPFPLGWDGPSDSRLVFEVGDTPEIMEAPSHDTQANAQAVTLPVTINGRVASPGQWDVFRFQIRAGEAIVAQVRARRLGSPLDSVLILTDAAGRPLAVNDDHGDNREAGLETHHADSYIRTNLDVAGTYYLHLGDMQQAGGPGYGYRLRLSTPRPDFELRIAPSAINLSPGENVPVAVYAVRKDGFAGDIDLSLKDAPTGLVLSGGRIGAAQDRVWVTLSALATAPRGGAAFRIEGRADVGGRPVVREARPVEDMMQAFLWRHLVPAWDLSANLPPDAAPRPPITLLSDVPVSIPAGASAGVDVDVIAPAGTNIGPVQFELIDPPEGISVQAAGSAKGSARMVLACDEAKLKPGAKGNLIAVAYVMVTPQPWSPASYKPRFSHDELMRAIKEAPPLPDKVPARFVHSDPGLDRMVDDMDAPAPMDAKPKAPAPAPEPVPLKSLPPQRVNLGRLPAIMFEVVAR
jgi:hypothetical protein